MGVLACVANVEGVVMGVNGSMDGNTDRWGMALEEVIEGEAIEEEEAGEAVTIGLVEGVVRFGDLDRGGSKDGRDSSLGYRVARISESEEGEPERALLDKDRGTGSEGVKERGEDDKDGVDAAREEGEESADKEGYLGRISGGGRAVEERTFPVEFTLVLVEIAASNSDVVGCGSGGFA